MPAPKMRRLHIDGVTKTFGQRTALDEFTLDVTGGEFVALLGPSGCGKSTMLNCLAGLMPLTAGTITVDDERVDPLPPERRGFGMVFQNYALFPHLSVGRNVAFGLEARGVDKTEATGRVAEALDRVRLADFAGSYPAQLSGGQQQRVAMARAIVLEPSLILMDEPLSNLDAQLRTELRTELRRLHQDLGLTTVYVTHDQSEALSLADRIVILRHGRTLQVGVPQDVYTQPTGAFVAGFMGYRNLLPVELKESHGGRATVRLADSQVHLDGVDRSDGAAGGLVAAVRPEDFRLTGDGGPNPVQLTVDVVEYQGHEFAVDTRGPGGARVHVRSDTRLEVGQQVTATVDPERVLVFGDDQ